MVLRAVHATLSVGDGTRSGTVPAVTQRVIMVTGSAGGIGNAITEWFGARGDVVVGLDLADGFDITDRDACGQAVAETSARHGAVDVLCNIAGVGAVGDVVAATDGNRMEESNQITAGCSCKTSWM